jgi:hypothetical protein
MSGFSLDVPPRWRPRLERHLGGPRRLGAADFLHDLVLIRYADGSHQMFHFGLVLHDASLDEIAVFTEHCGYHFLPAHGLKITLYQQLDQLQLETTN